MLILGFRGLLSCIDAHEYCKQFHIFYELYSLLCFTKTMNLQKMKQQKNLDAMIK